MLPQVLKVKVMYFKISFAIVRQKTPKSLTPWGLGGFGA
jgi:hypothetical protein